MTNNNQPKKLLVSDTYVKQYTATGAEIASHISYHIAKHGNFDAAPLSISNYLNVDKKTVLRYLSEFKKDGVFKETQGKYTFRQALVFGDNAEFYATFNAYYSVINKTEKQKNDSVSLVRVILGEMPEGLSGKQFESFRMDRFIAAFLRDKTANQHSNFNETIYYAKSLTAFAKHLGVCVNTIKRVIESLSAQWLIETSREQGRLLIHAVHELKRHAQRKANKIVEDIALKIDKRFSIKNRPRSGIFQT